MYSNSWRESKYVSIYLNCEQNISVFVQRMKLPAAAKDQQDSCHQVKIDVDQEVAHDLASVEHVDEMSTKISSNRFYV